MLILQIQQPQGLWKCLCIVQVNCMVLTVNFSLCAELTLRFFCYQHNCCHWPFLIGICVTLSTTSSPNGQQYMCGIPIIVAQVHLIGWAHHESTEKTFPSFYKRQFVASYRYLLLKTNCSLLLCRQWCWCAQQRDMWETLGAILAKLNAHCCFFLLTFSSAPWLMLWVGSIKVASPEWTPASSTCSVIAWTRTWTDKRDYYTVKIFTCRSHIQKVTEIPSQGVIFSFFFPEQPPVYNVSQWKKYTKTHRQHAEPV